MVRVRVIALALNKYRCEPTGRITITVMRPTGRIRPANKHTAALPAELHSPWAVLLITLFAVFD